MLVQVRGDTVREPDETFNLLLTRPVGARVADGVGIGGIVDND